MSREVCERCGPCLCEKADASQKSASDFDETAVDLESYKTFAIAMLHAGQAVLEVSMEADSINQEDCDMLVQEFFGGGSCNCDMARKGELFENIGRMLQQTRCNESKIAFFRDHPNPETVKKYNTPEKADVCAFAAPSQMVGKSRTLYAGPSWYQLTPLDRATTFVHELSHACLGTADHTYDVKVCKELPWNKSSTNAQNYELFCLRAFCSILGGEMLTVISNKPCPVTMSTNQGADWEPNVVVGGLKHMQGRFTIGGKFLIRLVGDKYGDKAQKGRQRHFHKICQQATVQSSTSDGSRFTLSVRGAGFQDHPASKESYTSQKPGTDGAEPEYAKIDDGMNVLYIKMLSNNVGFGLCHCGGDGGRSFAVYNRNASVKDGMVV